MRTALLILVVVLALSLGWCYVRRPETTFSGTIRDPSNAPIAGAEVTVGGETTETDSAGGFIVRSRPAELDRWILDVRSPGYAPISKVLAQGAADIELTAVKTTTQTFDAGSAIVARDVQASCVGSLAARVDWAAYPAARFPQVIGADGNRALGSVPAAARQLLAHGMTTPPCASGFQVSIPANSLVTASGQPVQGQVEVDVSTVDLYSPDGMPGDYTVAVSPETRATAAYMESFGAGTITIRKGNEMLQLAQGTTAEILIPVDRGQLEAGAIAPATIPLLRYETKTGLWQSIGTATLDTARRSYVATVEHLSEFNADIVKTNPGCVRFDASGISGSFDLVVTARTTNGGFRQVTRQVQPNAAQINPNLHAVYNLPPNDWVVLRVIKSGQPVGTWIVGTGGAWGGSGNPPYDYAACGAVFALSEVVTNSFTLDGTGRRHGLLPKHVAFLVGTTGDVYPVGGGTGCPNLMYCSYVFSLFDTGSTIVKLDPNLSTFLGIGATPASAWDVDVRLNGLGAVAANLSTNFGPPGTANGAEANSGNLRVGARPTATQVGEPEFNAAGTTATGSMLAVSYMLAGAPVAKNIVARIDYTAPVTKGPWNLGFGYFKITGPNIQFFRSGDAGIPAPALTLFVEGFGAAAAANDGHEDQRHFLQNVTLSYGSNYVFDDQTVTNPTRFLYDTGARMTVISQALATALGVTPASPSAAAGCSPTNTVNFVRLDSIVIVGMNAANQLGTYRVDNAEVCVDVPGANIIIAQYPDPTNPSAGLLVDGIIGANLFDKILWNGPQQTLGVLP
jgi:hypothetical protein